MIFPLVCLGAFALVMRNACAALHVAAIYLFYLAKGAVR